MNSVGSPTWKTSSEPLSPLNSNVPPSTSLTAESLPRSSSLLFVDSRVSNYQSLIAVTQPGTEVHVLDSAQDAIAQITQALTGRSHISSLHVLSHGTAGSLELGSGWLNASSLDRHTSDLQSWSTALTDEADLLLYSCDVAAGEVGQTFVQQLAKLTGADVAASSDLTGNSALGGDWDLEVKTGEITAPLAFSQTAMSQYAQTLDIIINELQRSGTFATAEYIEFLLTTDYTAAALQNLFFGDSNSSTSNKSGIYNFKGLSPIATTFKAGTIIVAGGSTVVSTDEITYNPIAGGTDDQWNIRLKFGGSYINNVSGTGDFANQDSAWVDNSGAGTLTSIHSIAYKATGSYGAFGSAATIKLNVTTADPVIQFNGNGTQATDSTKFSFAASGTLGSANGGDNSAYINSLRNPNSPPIAQASSVTFNEDNTYGFQAFDFGFSASNGGTLQSVQITQLATIGQLFLDADGSSTQDPGEAVTANQIVTLPDISKLKFKPIADANGSNYTGFKFKVSDGQAFSDSDATMTLNVSAANDAPMLDISGNPTLPSLNQGVTNSAGVRVTDLIASLGGAGITEVDRGSLNGIAVTGVNNTNGSWQYSTGGSTWTAFGSSVADNSATVLLGSAALYNSALGNAPDQQGWLSYTNLKIESGVPTPGTSTQSANTTGTSLDTRADSKNYAGYSNYDVAQQQVNPTFPTLDRTSGYSLSFNLKLLAESRTNENRAGFSAIAISSDKRGIELGFQQITPTTGRIFAQSDDITVNPGGEPNGLFLAAESISFDTNQAVNYSLNIKGDTYQLLADGVQVLTGVLRDYTNWSSTPDPYETPNFIFLGDDTTSAQASFNLSQVVLRPETRVRFVPNASYSGSAEINFRAWDGTNGVANGASGVNASLNGGITAFSTATETAMIAVNPLPTFSINNVTQTEGNSGTKTYTFTVSLSQPSTNTISVDYTTLDGSATTGNSDYVTKSGTLTFAPNQTSATIEIQVNGDTNFELDETFRLRLANANNARIVPDADTGIGTIRDDDRSQWSIIKTADFDKDGSQDILWRNLTTGGAAIWKMNGTTFNTSIPLPVAGLSWKFEGVADFDKNGFVDILLRNTTTGTPAVWLMNGFTVTNSVALPFANLSWQIAGLADFNKDGSVDILWRNASTGGNAIWQMNGTNVANSLALSFANSTWQIAGLGDFDDDGFVDILWRNNGTGANAFWKMNGSSVQTSVALSAADSTWQIARIADFNNDGFSDILWRNTTTGGTATWRMNGTSNPSSTALSFADLNYQVEDITDLNGDGFVDILWRNYSTGSNALWKMNDTSVASSIVLRPA